MDQYQGDIFSPLCHRLLFIMVMNVGLNLKVYAGGFISFSILVTIFYPLTYAYQVWDTSGHYPAESE